MDFFIITTFVTAAIAVLGQTLDPTASFGYDAFYSPLIFALISVVPSLLTYSRKELSLRQMLLRKFLHFTLLVGLLILFTKYAGILDNVSDAARFALTVLIVYLGVNLVNWQLDSKRARQINKNLKAIQGRQ